MPKAKHLFQVILKLKLIIFNQSKCFKWLSYIIPPPKGGTNVEVPIYRDEADYTKSKKDFRKWFLFRSIRNLITMICIEIRFLINRDF